MEKKDERKERGRGKKIVVNMESKWMVRLRTEQTQVREQTDLKRG